MAASDEKSDRNKSVIAIMAAILLLPKLRELNVERGVVRGSPKWISALNDAISLAEQIFEKVENRHSR